MILGPFSLLSVLRKRHFDTNIYYYIRSEENRRDLKSHKIEEKVIETCCTVN
jgi:hypothetical protein